MEFSAKAKVCGILANPVKHSLSPLMQHTFAKYYNKDFVYVPLLVKEGLSHAVKGAFAMNFAGMNVTLPYKVEVMYFLSEVDDVALKIGAVNTLVQSEFGYKGYNTDMDGLRLCLERKQIDLSNRHVLVFGAGGVSKAVLYLAKMSGASRISLVNRDVDKAKRLLQEMWIEGDVIDLENINRAPNQYLHDTGYIAFQCTGVGMYPNVSDCVITNPMVFDTIDIGVDMIYTPNTTVFMEKCHHRGKTAINGLDMLIYQGLLSFCLWNPDVTPEEDVVDEVRKLLLAQLQTN